MNACHNNNWCVRKVDGAHPWITSHAAGCIVARPCGCAPSQDTALQLSGIAAQKAKPVMPSTTALHGIICPIIRSASLWAMYSCTPKVRMTGIAHSITVTCFNSSWESLSLTKASLSSTVTESTKSDRAAALRSPATLAPRTIACVATASAPGAGLARRGEAAWALQSPCTFLLLARVRRFEACWLCTCRYTEGDTIACLLGKSRAQLSAPWMPWGGFWSFICCFHKTKGAL